MRKVYRKTVFTVFCCVLFSFAVFRGFECRASEENVGELVLLIDSSGTMGNYLDDVKQWTNEIGAYVQNTRVRVHLIRFGEQTGFLYSDRIDSSGFDRYAEAVQMLSTGDEWTDQASAMGEAVKVLNGSQSERTCIVMLSDGRLDYEKDELEIYGKQRFCDAVDEYLESVGNSVILIQFGNGETDAKEDETYIFGNINENVKLIKLEFGEESAGGKLPLKETLENVLPKLLEGLEMEYEETPVVIQSNPYEFLLDKDCSSIMLKMELSEGELDEDTIEEFVVKKGDTIIDKRVFKCGKKVCFLYFENLSAGKYIINLPDGKWNCNSIGPKNSDAESVNQTDKVNDPQNSPEGSSNILEDDSESSIRLEDTKKVDEKIDVKEVFQIPTDDKEYYIYICGEKKFILNISGDYDDYSFEDNFLYFHTAGEYEVRVKSEDKYLETVYYYTIKELNFLEKIIKYLNEKFSS